MANPTVGTAPRRSTRSTRSTRAPVTPETPKRTVPERERQQLRMIRTEPVQQAPSLAPRTKGKGDAAAPRVRKSTRNVIRTEPTRREVFTEKREQARFKAPAQFVAVLFGVVVVSVFAFGLLRDDPAEEAQDAKPEMHEELRFEKTDATSTNTGILRGSGGN